MDDDKDFLPQEVRLEGLIDGLTIKCWGERHRLSGEEWTPIFNQILNAITKRRIRAHQAGQKEAEILKVLAPYEKQIADINTET